MPKVKIDLDHGEFADFLKGPEVREPLRDIAEKAATQARSTAPVATGAYRDSIHVEADTTDRAVVRVVASDRKASIVEARTGNLKRALGKAKR